MYKNFKNNKKFFFTTIIVIIIPLFLLWQNNSITITKSTYKNPKIPKEFDGYSIVHISDLHNKKFGRNQKHLLGKVKGASPDIILITGDLIDRRKYDLNTAMEFIEGAVKISPVYYVPGNHEAWSGDYKNIRKRLVNSGVNVLDDKKIKLKKDIEEIEILGLSDPAFLTIGYMDGTNTSMLKENLSLLKADSIFQILLSHRPELFDLYVAENIDLIFSGHAHGGQFRLPFIGGLVAPNQGLFPKLTSGFHKKGDSTLYISRGLGNSIIPIRIFNRPEIVWVTLKR